MPRAGLSAEAVLDRAAQVADEQGLEQLTLAAVAAGLGVRVPSLYKHLPGGLPELRRRLGVRAKHELAAVLRRAAVGRARGDALRALAAAYQDWARRSPGRYAAAQAVAPGDEEDERAGREAAQVVFDVLAGYGVDDDTLVDATRALRAGLHGFAALDAAGGYAMPRSLPASIGWWLDALDAALSGSPGR